MAYPKGHVACTFRPTHSMFFDPLHWFAKSPLRSPSAGSPSTFHMEFWPQSRWPRGFTFFWADKKTVGLWPREELFIPGDFVVHTHEADVVRQATHHDQMAATRCWGRLDS